MRVYVTLGDGISSFICCGKVKYNKRQFNKKRKLLSRTGHRHPMLNIWDMGSYLLNSKYASKLLGCPIDQVDTWKTEVLTFWEKFKEDPRLTKTFFVSFTTFFSMYVSWEMINYKMV